MCSDMCAFVYMLHAGLGLLLLNALCSLLLNSQKCDLEMWVSFVGNSFLFFILNKVEFFFTLCCKECFEDKAIGIP